MKHFLWSLVLVFLAAAPAWSRPELVPLNRPNSVSGGTLVFRSGDVTDSSPIGVSGFCTVRFQQSGGDDVSLYAVTSSTAAASSGTLLNAFTASTTPATPAFTFTASTQWVKAVATDATAGGSVMVIECAPLVGSGSGGSGSFLAETYSAGSVTGGIQEAITACHNAGGGVVILPVGMTTIDGSDASFSSGIVINTTLDPLDFQADCDLIGYGSARPSEGGTDADFGTFLLITNATGKTGIRVNGSGQTLSDFSVQMTGTNASSVGIELASPTTGVGTCDGSCEKGEFGISSAVIQRVGIFGPTENTGSNATNGGPGIGLNIIGTLKSQFESVEVLRWDAGIQYSPIGDLTPATGGSSNANTFTGITARKNDKGLYINDPYVCQEILLLGSTFESNYYGIHVTSAVTGTSADCLITDVGGHYENWQINWYLQGAGLSTVSISSLFSVASGGGMTKDVVRDVAQQHSIDDVYFNYKGVFGPDYSAGAMRVHGGMSNGVTATNNGTNTFGDIGWHATDCPGTYGVPTDTFHLKNVKGDLCYEVDSKSMWQCQPATGTDGQCDSAGDWVNVDSTGSTVYGPSFWAISNGTTLDTGTEVCAAKALSCQDVIEFSVPATPTDSACATAQASTNKFISFCF